jgi:hypothetical protein
VPVIAHGNGKLSADALPEGDDGIVPAVL